MGATGLETAGYTKSLYPDKKVACCQRGKVIMPAFPGIHEMAMTQMKEIGVELMLETGFDESMRADWDIVLDCRGFKYLGPQGYMQGSFAECLDKKTGQIFVNNHG